MGFGGPVHQLEDFLISCMAGLERNNAIKTVRCAAMRILTVGHWLHSKLIKLT